MLIMLGTMLLPWQVLVPGSYELMYHLHWIDSYLAIIVPGAVSVLGIILFRQAMLGVPEELLQCGRLDGCSELRLWWDIALPVSAPDDRGVHALEFSGRMEQLSLAADHPAERIQIHAADRPEQPGRPTGISAQLRHRDGRDLGEHPAGGAAILCACNAISSAGWHRGR